MVLKRLQYYIYITLLLFFLVLQSSCDKKTRNKITTKKNITKIDTLLSIGHKLYEKEEFDSSYYYYNKAKNEAEILKDTSRVIHSLSWLAQIQRNQGDYTGSESTSIEALPYIGNKGRFPFGETNIYIGLGNNYLNTYEYDNAIYYFKKAINSKTDEVIKPGIINNIGLAYSEKGEYQKALQILNALILQKGIIKNYGTYARINDNLGHTYDKVNNSKAFYYLNKGLQIRKKQNDNWEIIGSYYHFSEYYKTKNSNLSNKYALMAYKKSTKLKTVDTRLESLKLLIQNCSPNQSKKYSTLYIKINDSITKVRQKAKNQFAKIKYDSKKEKGENLKLKEQKNKNILQLEIQKKRTQVLFFIVGILISLFGFIYYYLKNKNKREKIQASYKTEVQIAKKLHDELANDVYQTMAFAETQDLSTKLNKETLLSSLDAIYFRTRNISKENSYIETGIHFIPNLKEMISDFNTNTTTLLINGLDGINWALMEKTKKITVYRVLQELLVNMKKHSKSSLVVLSFKINKNMISIDYTDNGVGENFDKINLKNGLQNVKNRILAIKGTVTFDTKSEKGFKVKITFPK